jgi:hypothetical protein
MHIGKNRFFQASQIAKAIGMPEKRLGKFVESPGYKIKPSVRAEGGKGAPRLYDLPDLLSIALAWWLFQAGHRSQVIGRVLEAKGVRKSLAESEHWSAEEAKNRFMIVKREMSSYEPPPQDVRVGDPDEIISDIKLADRHAFQVLPIGSLLLGLWERLREPQSKGE